MLKIFGHVKMAVCIKKLGLAKSVGVKIVKKPIIKNILQSGKKIIVKSVMLVGVQRIGANIVDNTILEITLLKKEELIIKKDINSNVIKSGNKWTPGGLKISISGMVMVANGGQL